MAITQARGSNQIKDNSVTRAKLVADFLAGSDLDLTNGNNDATITGLINPSNPQDAATKDYVDGLVDNSLKQPEAYDASVNSYPTTYGGAGVQAGDSFRITAAGTLGSRTVNVEDLLIALVDTPGQTDGNWMVAESNRDQATETVLGVAKIATQALVNAGVNDTDFVTPLKLKNAMDSNHIQAGAGLTLDAGTDPDTFNVVATDLSILVGTNDLGVNIGNTNGTSLEVSATGLELTSTITGARSFTTGNAAFSVDSGTANLDLTSTGVITLHNDINDARLTTSPDGTVPLAIATVDYVDNNSSGKFTPYANEEKAVTNGSAVLPALSHLGTHATDKVVRVKVFLNGVRQNPGAGNDYTLNATTGVITFNFNLATGDVALVDYESQDA